MEPTNPDVEALSPSLRRLADAVAGMVADLPDDRRAELATLALLSDDVTDCMVTVNYREDLDAFDVTWLERVIGTVSRPWLLTGEVPDDFPQVDGGLT